MITFSYSGDDKTIQNLLFDESFKELIGTYKLQTDKRNSVSILLLVTQHPCKVFSEQR